MPSVFSTSGDYKNSRLLDTRLKDLKEALQIFVMYFFFFVPAIFFDPSLAFKWPVPCDSRSDHQSTACSSCIDRSGPPCVMDLIRPIYLNGVCKMKCRGQRNHPIQMYGNFWKTTSACEHIINWKSFEEMIQLLSCPMLCVCTAEIGLHLSDLYLVCTYWMFLFCLTIPLVLFLRIER